MKQAFEVSNNKLKIKIRHLKLYSTPIIGLQYQDAVNVKDTKIIFQSNQILLTIKRS